MPRLTRREMLASTSAVIVTSGFSGFAWGAATASPPPTRVAPVTDTYWGVDIVDRYRWMEARPETAEWTAWLKAQGDFARAQLDALPGRTAMAKAIDAYTEEADQASPPQIAGGRLFLQRRRKGDQSWKIYVREGEAGAERLLLDPNEGRDPNGKPASLDFIKLAPDGQHLAFGLSDGGSEITKSYVRNVTSGETVLVSAISSRGEGWTGDGKGFFYYRLRKDAVFGATDYRTGGSCWLHRIGTDPASDIEIFRSGEGTDFEAQESDHPAVTGAPGSDWIIATHLLNDQDRAQLYVARASELGTGKIAWRKIAVRKDNIQGVAIVGDTIYLLANGRQSNGELVAVDARTGDFSSGKVVLAAGDGVIDIIAPARDGIYVHGLSDGQGSLTRVGYDGRIDRIKPPRGGALWALGAARDADGLWFGMDDLTEPAATFHLDGKTLVARQVDFAPPSKVDVSRYRTDRLSVTVRDGVEVPVQILRRADAQKNGRNPVLIIAYGAYGVLLDPAFNAETLAFLDAGGMIVYAGVRGGGEKGEAWHNAGRKATKFNTWRDAIDTAEYMIAQGWTGKAHLSIWGTSAGGIMVGRAITERPDLFAAAIGDVGCFNILRMELTANGPGNDAEFGTVKKEDEFRALLMQDSYHAVKDGVRYPATLVITGANDQRVESWIPGKFAARLQAASTNRPGALLRVDYDSGHHAPSVKTRNALTTDVYTFLLAHTKA